MVYFWAVAWERENTAYGKKNWGLPCLKITWQSKLHQHFNTDFNSEEKEKEASSNQIHLN